MAKKKREGAPEDSNEYETPADFYRRLFLEFTFDGDAFANPLNAKAPHFFSVARSAFEHPWTWRAVNAHDYGRPMRWFANPPYSSNKLGRAVRRAAAQSAEHHALVVMLVPPSTDTRWWSECVMREAAEVRFLRGRLSFCYRGVPLKGNRNTSCVIVFRPGVHGPQFSTMDATL